MGLAHPHDGGSEPDGTKFPGVINSGSTGTYGLNQGIWTVMSYNSDWDEAQTNTLSHGHGILGAFDIAALQQLYGKNTNYNTGNNVYHLPTVNASGTGWLCIWDAGGIDTVSNSGSSLDCGISLLAAPLTGPNAGGYVSFNVGIRGGYTIANGVVIENAIGGSGDDVIFGNDYANVLSGGAGDDTIWGAGGNDTIDGGAGIDRLWLLGSRNNFSISKLGTDIRFVDLDSGFSQGTKIVRNVEWVEFLTNDELYQINDLLPDTTPPQFQSASVSEDGTKIILTYNEDLSATTAPSSAFAVRIGTATAAVSAVALGTDPKTLELTLASTIKSGQTVTVGYRPPKADGATTNAAIQDVAGNDALAIPTNTRVTNNVQAFNIASRLQSGVTSEEGTKVIFSNSIVTVHLDDFSPINSPPLAQTFRQSEELSSDDLKQVSNLDVHLYLKELFPEDPSLSLYQDHTEDYQFDNGLKLFIPPNITHFAIE